MAGKQGNQGNSRRGFASMDEEKRREIASKGGKAAHDKGTAHEFTSEEAREAGRKGGQASGNSRGKRDVDDDDGGGHAGPANSTQRSGRRDNNR